MAKKINKQEYIEVRGAREHNLKNINVDIPINNITVITGLSGSGKSSLAFDTLYAEGQRRYVESLSAYARQFLGMMHKPDVDAIKGLSPAISIDQKSTSRNPRSTVGTVTEVYDYLRLLFAKVGQPHCHTCGEMISSSDPQAIVDSLFKEEEKSNLIIMASLIRQKKGSYEKLLQNLFRQGYARVRVNGKIYDLPSDIKLAKYQKHSIEVVVDKVRLNKENRSRITDAVETAMDISNESQIIVLVNDKKELYFNTQLYCSHCELYFENIQPRSFSFNSPFGACETCSGLGTLREFAVDLIVPDPSLSVMDGGVLPWKRQVLGFVGQKLEAVANHFSFDLFTPFKKLPEDIQNILLHGSKEKIKFKLESGSSDAEYSWSGYFEGLIPQLERLYNETNSESRRRDIAKYMRIKTCPECEGRRLKPQILAVTIQKKSIFDLTDIPIGASFKFFNELSFEGAAGEISKPILREIKSRLKFLTSVGLEYLTLTRSAGTLSGGEAQRIRLATQIGSELRGVLYILDEPSIGLHQRDNMRLIETLKNLRELGNTLVIVEHDEETMMASDHIIDIGPGAGVQGGGVIAKGTPAEIKKNPKSITGKYLSGKNEIAVPQKRRDFRNTLDLRGAKEHNLKSLFVKIPLKVFTCVTGVSGSGKSTLINDVLYKAIAKVLYTSKEKPGEYDSLDNVGLIDKALIIDQRPIGRTPRSNPATYTKVFDEIRALFAQTPEAKFRGYKQGRFSFNVKGGRCEHCQGGGLIKVEMQFLPDVYVECERCKGKRYNRETLEVHYKGKNIADILDLTVDEAFEFFRDIPAISDKMQTLVDVGLGYVKLGQSATTLSGGEAQRIKLSAELSKRATGQTLYIMDEPTTGLHFEDIKKLLAVINRLVDKGNSVIVIEHNLDVVKCADWIIDLGPEGGDKGGEVIAEGSPEEVVKVAKSYTGKYLKKLLK